MTTRRWTMTLLNVLVSMLAWSQSEGFYFTSTSVEGVEVSYYSQSSEYPYYCSVEGKPTTEGGMSQPAINTTTTGSVTIPESVHYNGNTYHVEHISMNAFNSCSQITSVMLPESVYMIDESAFYGCRNLKSVRLPKKAVHDYTFFIGYAAFENCTSLTEISLPESLKELPGFAFNNCYKLQSVTLPSTLTTIGGGAFQGCTDLATVTVKAAVPPTLDESAFDNTSNITLRVPQGSKAAYEAADSWKNFKEITENASLHVISFADLKVKELCVAHWDSNSDGELDEGEAAAVTDLGAVFQWTPEVNETPFEIRSFDELKYFTGLTAIGEDAFSGCGMLASVALPSTLTSIGARAFYGCYNLNSIDIPNSVTSIGSQAFFGCSSLTSFHIPASVSIIYGNPIINCPKVASITVASDNANYDSRDNCNAIIRTSINTLIAGCMSSVVPNTVEKIGWGAFEECSNLASITVPSSVTTITDRAFYNCSSLETITISNGVQTIGASAFYGCNFSSLTIPASVTSIGGYAFYGCQNLNTVKAEMRTPCSIAETVFQYYNKSTGKTEFTTAKLKVPYDCKAVYETTDYWNKFSVIEETAKCATPTISFKDGRLHFECETEDVEYHVTVTTPGTEELTGNDIALPLTYIVKVYASKEDYTDSDVATANINVRGMKGDLNEDNVVNALDIQEVIDIASEE